MGRYACCDLPSWYRLQGECFLRRCLLLGSACSKGAHSSSPLRGPHLTTHNLPLSPAARTVGCILAELLQRKPLFPGKDYIDQLKLIIKTLGSPSEEELGFISAPKARAYIQALPAVEVRRGRAGREGTCNGGASTACLGQQAHLARKLSTGGAQATASSCETQPCPAALLHPRRSPISSGCSQAPARTLWTCCSACCRWARALGGGCAGLVVAGLGSGKG